MAVDEVWTVQVVEFVDVPKPDPTGMSDGELFVRNTVRSVTIGGTFASFQIKGVSVNDVAAIAAKRMDDIRKPRAGRCRASRRSERGSALYSLPLGLSVFSGERGLAPRPPFSLSWWCQPTRKRN